MNRRNAVTTQQPSLHPPEGSELAHKIVFTNPTTTDGNGLKLLFVSIINVEITTGSSWEGVRPRSVSGRQTGAVVSQKPSSQRSFQAPYVVTLRDLHNNLKMQLQSLQLVSCVSKPRLTNLVLYLSDSEHTTHSNQLLPEQYS